MPYWKPTLRITRPLLTTCLVDTPDRERVEVPINDGEHLIGRAPGAALRIDDDRVARQHAVLRRTRVGLEVEDLVSENGTWVVRQLIPGVPQSLHVGDTILLGGSRLSFVHSLPEAPPPPPDVARLIAAICEAPEDDEPRLVLADLLTSRGDPRGEFISCQIAAELSVNAEASARADALLAMHELDWLAPLPIPVVSWTFRRGFLDCIWVQPGQSVVPLNGRHPLRAVVVVG